MIIDNSGTVGCEPLMIEEASTIDMEPHYDQKSRTAGDAVLDHVLDMRAHGTLSFATVRVLQASLLQLHLRSAVHNHTYP